MVLKARENSYATWWYGFIISRGGMNFRIRRSTFDHNFGNMPMLCTIFLKLDTLTRWCCTFKVICSSIFYVYVPPRTQAPVIFTVVTLMAEAERQAILSVLKAHADECAANNSGSASGA